MCSQAQYRQPQLLLQRYMQSLLYQAQALQASPRPPPPRAGSHAFAAWSLLIWCTSGAPPLATPLNTPAVLWAQAGAAGQTRPSPRKGGGLFDIAGHLGLARQGGRGAIRGRLQDRTPQGLFPDRAWPPVRQPVPEVPRLTADGLFSVQPALQKTAAAASSPTRMPAEVRCQECLVAGCRAAWSVMLCACMDSCTGTVPWMRR